MTFFELIGTDPYVQRLNSWTKRIDDISERLVEVHVEGAKIASQAYREGQRTVYKRGVGQIKVTGGFSRRYMRMGDCPRIVSARHSLSSNAVQRPLRDAVYSWAGVQAARDGMCIVDVDLKSCYTSVFLGLLSDGRLDSVRSAVTSVGIWEYLRKTMERQNALHLYDKRFVKICVYSSFFEGGSKAMAEGILKTHREELGLSGSEFKASPMFPDLYRKAYDLAGILQNTDVIVDLRTVSEEIREKHLDEVVYTPTGQSVRLTKEGFRTTYPKVLQGYELGLLGQATMDLQKENPSIKVLAHCNDGNVLLVGQTEVETLMSQMSDHVDRIGKGLRLGFPQKVEYKVVEPDDSWGKVEG